MKSIFIITFVCLLNSYTHAADFPIGNYICNAGESIERITKISIEEIRAGTSSLPLVQLEIVSGDTRDIPNRLNGIATIEERNNITSMFIGRVTIRYDKSSKKMNGDPYGACEKL